MTPLRLLVFITLVGFSVSFHSTFATPKLVPHHISLANGKSFDLNLPEGYSINIAVQGLKRVRFMTLSPDNRLFVTDMYNKADNHRGVVYILDNFDLATHQFKKVTKYLSGLRNPNSVGFYRDPSGTDWFYLALTDRLVRYRYEAAKDSPSGQPEVLATFPDYGLGYKYGGWHLTRTVSVGGNGKIYVAVGSSCNACKEKEEVRASILEMDPDGKNHRYYARGLRNAVGLRWINGKLYATNMGSDHLGDNRPNDTFYAIEDGKITVGPIAFKRAPASIRIQNSIQPARISIVGRCRRRLRLSRLTVLHSDFSILTPVIPQICQDLFWWHYMDRQKRACGGVIR